MSSLEDVRCFEARWQRVLSSMYQEVREETCFQQKVNYLLYLPERARWIAVVKHHVLGIDMCTLCALG